MIISFKLKLKIKQITSIKIYDNEWLRCQKPLPFDTLTMNSTTVTLRVCNSMEVDLIHAVLTIKVIR